MTSEWKAFAIEREREIAMEKEEVPYGYHDLREFCEQRQFPYFDVRETDPNINLNWSVDAQLQRHWNATQRNIRRGRSKITNVMSKQRIKQ